MILYAAVVISVVFASGTFLLLQRDATRVVVGIILVSNSAVLFIIAAGLTRGRPPIYPLEDPVSVSDPLVQAMARTALIIGFGSPHCSYPWSTASTPHTTPWTWRR
jgi:multicomponent Na+:H+ antiporter subunit C